MGNNLMELGKRFHQLKSEMLENHITDVISDVISDVMNSILYELEKESKLSLEKSKEYESVSFEDSRWFDGNSSGINYAINLIKSKLK